MAEIKGYPAQSTVDDSDKFLLQDGITDATKYALLSDMRTKILNQNAVSGAALATTAITLGYAQITTNFSTSSATAVQVTGLTVTVTIPAGGRRVKVTAFSPQAIDSVASNIVLSVWDGTVGSGTQIGGGTDAVSAANLGGPLFAISVPPAPSSGSKTYNVGLSTTAGTATLGAAAIAPAYILVELI